MPLTVDKLTDGLSKSKVVQKILSRLFDIKDFSDLKNLYIQKRQKYNKPLTVLKGVLPKLVPFFKTVIIFFLLYPTDPSNTTVIYCFFKCLPVVWLCVFVCLHGLSLGIRHRYSRFILAGLLASAIGDAFLVWKADGYFVHGMGAFGFAHIFYTIAFGFKKPLKVKRGIFTIILASLIYSTLLPGISPGLRVPVALYLFLIGMMMWRALARFEEIKKSWVKLCSTLGAILFVTSDSFIAVNKFVTPLPESHVTILVTYYGAQLFLALTVVDNYYD